MEAEYDSDVAGALHRQNTDDGPDTDFDVSVEMGCARGICYALVFAAPFWLGVIAIVALA